MNNQWMKKTLIAVSINMVVGTVYAADTDSQVENENLNQSIVEGDKNNKSTVQAQEDTTSQSVVNSSEPIIDKNETPSLVPKENSNAAAALQQKEGDATQETNLQEVFTSNERQYSLIKKGDLSTFYDLDYSYYRDSQLNASMDDRSLTQLRIDEDANHTLTNTFTAQYGVLDNLTFSASVPFVAKSDSLRDTTTAGLGDISLGARWEPFPLKAGRMPLILFGTLSTKTGDSPFEINPETELQTGKGYYSVGVGASTRKYIDPVVLFASLSTSYGFKETGLNQIRGGGNANGEGGDGYARILDTYEPGLTTGFSFGFAYSFNYDVSLTMSYQQSFNTGTKYSYTTGEEFSAAVQSSAMFSVALGVRVNPETIVNGTIGIGLTEDAPDIALGLSFPLDILGFGKKKRS